MKPEPLFLTEAQIADRIGINFKDWQIALVALERGGFPLPDPLFANRRYWPACRAFLDRRYGLGAPHVSQTALAEDGEETWTQPNRPIKRSAR